MSESEDVTADRRRGGRRKRRRHHRGRRIALIAVVVVLAVLAGTAVAGYVYLDRHIQTFSTAGIAKHRPKPTPATDILIIGTDARGGENTKLGGAGDRIGRSDTTILIHVYPGGRRAVGVSIPRDSLVTIPPCRLPNGTWTKAQPDTMFNAAFSVGLMPAGNPECTVNTVEKMTGIRIDHTVIANFAGFAAMSKAVGGVPVCLPNAVYQGDLNPNLGYQGKLLFKQGLQTVEGARALQYVRIRHGLGDGSDIGRIKRQQAFLSSLLKTVRSNGLQPSHILPLVNAATKALTFDSSLSTPAKLFSFAKSLINLKPSNIDFVTVPWVYDGARVAIVQSGARALWHALRTDEPLTGSTKKKIRLPRGSGAVTVADSGAGSTATASIVAKLGKAGFTATSGPASSASQATSVVTYPPADRTRALLLARYVKATLREDTNATAVTLTLGRAHRWLASSKGHRLPASVTDNLRKATAGLCSDISEG